MLSKIKANLKKNFTNTLSIFCSFIEFLWQIAFLLNQLYLNFHLIVNISCRSYGLTVFFRIFSSFFMAFVVWRLFFLQRRRTLDSWRSNVFTSTVHNAHRRISMNWYALKDESKWKATFKLQFPAKVYPKNIMDAT